MVGERGAAAVASSEDLAFAAEARAGEIHNALGPIEQNHRTSAVLVAEDREGKSVNIIAGGKRDLNPAQRSLAGPGDVLAKNPNEHAEITALIEARQRGLQVQAIGTSRPFCSACEQTLRQNGARITSPTTAVWDR
jgi:hypothetical protein